MKVPWWWLLELTSKPPRRWWGTPRRKWRWKFMRRKRKADCRMPWRKWRFLSPVDSCFAVRLDVNRKALLSTLVKRDFGRDKVGSELQEINWKRADFRAIFTKKELHCCAALMVRETGLEPACPKRTLEPESTSIMFSTYMKDHFRKESSWTEIWTGCFFHFIPWATRCPLNNYTPEWQRLSIYCADLLWLYIICLKC